MKKHVACICFFLYASVVFSQEVKISGKVTNIQKEDVQSAIVAVKDKDQETIAYSYTDNSGIFEITIAKPDRDTLFVNISSLGYAPEQKMIQLSSQKQFVLFFELKKKSKH